jgi:hypothetical protein
MKRGETMKRISIAILLFLALFLVTAAPAAKPAPAREKETVADTVVSLLGRLPETWRLKREARALARTLPDYPVTPPLPDSGLIYSWIEELCATPHRRPGTAEDRRAEEFLADRLREFGVQDVTLEPVPLTVWSARRWALTVGGEAMDGFYVVNSGFTGPEGVTAPLLWVGEGSARDFDRADARGKIVVAEVRFPYLPAGLLLKTTGAAYAVSDPDGFFTLGSGQYLNFVRTNFRGGTTAETAPPTDVYWNAVKRGARGVLLILRDQPSRYNTHYGPYDGIMKPLPALWIGKYDGPRLKALALAGTSATLTLEGEAVPGEMRNVWGVLPGVSPEIVLITSHHDSPFTGAVEDAAGAAQVLAQAWAWARVRPEERARTLVFVIDGGHFYGSLGGRAFAAAHPDLMRRTRVLLTLEHLGAKEVEEREGEYAETGRPALTVMFTTPDPRVLAAVMKALARKPPPLTIAIPADFFGPAPTSDAAGYVLEAGVPVVSWIGCPYYLLDSGDTLDKIDRESLDDIAATAAELVKNFLAEK